MQRRHRNACHKELSSDEPGRLVKQGIQQPAGDPFADAIDWRFGLLCKVDDSPNPMKMDTHFRQNTKLDSIVVAPKQFIRSVS